MEVQAVILEGIESEGGVQETHKTQERSKKGFLRRVVVDKISYWLSQANENSDLVERDSKFPDRFTINSTARSWKQPKGS